MRSSPPPSSTAMSSTLRHASRRSWSSRESRSFRGPRAAQTWRTTRTGHRGSFVRASTSSGWISVSASTMTPTTQSPRARSSAGGAACDMPDLSSTKMGRSVSSSYATSQPSSCRNDAAALATSASTSSAASPPATTASVFSGHTSAGLGLSPSRASRRTRCTRASRGITAPAATTAYAQGAPRWPEDAPPAGTSSSASAARARISGSSAVRASMHSSRPTPSYGSSSADAIGPASWNWRTSSSFSAEAASASSSAPMPVPPGTAVVPEKSPSDRRKSSNICLLRQRRLVCDPRSSEVVAETEKRGDRSKLFRAHYGRARAGRETRLARPPHAGTMATTSRREPRRDLFDTPSKERCVAARLSRHFPP